MSSLLSKLKTLVQASARGPRRSHKAPGQAQTAAQKPGDAPEVASAARRIQAEETKTSQAQASALAEPGPGEAQNGALEEERVVDILKGKQA